MNVVDLLARLRGLGVTLWADGSRLRYSAPKNALTPDLQAELVQHKTEILLILSQAAAADTGIPKLPPAAREQPLVLSFAQQRLWFLDQLAPGNPFYNIPAAIPLPGAVHPGILKQVLGEIVRRHETLRTTFTQVNGKPMQVVHPNLELPLPVTDLRTLPADQREREAARLATAEAQQPFNLSLGPLLRTQLLQLGDRDFILLITMHHIVSDGWSMDLFFKEFAVLYQAFAGGRPSPLPDLPVQYADFAAWQRQWLAGPLLDEHLSYWKHQLADLPTLELPTVYRRPAVPTFRGAYYPVRLPVEVIPALESLSQAQGVTLFMTLLAAFVTLLHRYSAQDDIVVGVPVAGRGRQEVESLIGFFINTLVLRTDVSGSPTFRDLLGRVRQVALGAYAHQDLPFEKLVEELQPERDLSRNPLCQVTFQLWHNEAAAPVAPAAETHTLEVERGTAIFDIAFRLWHDAQGIHGGFEYSTDLFDAPAIERMAGHYLTLLQGIAANPDARLADLPVITEAERTQLLVTWNDTVVDYGEPACLHTLFAAQAERTPLAQAVLDRRTHLTYQALNRRANQLAHYLRGLGVGADELVGVCMERSVDMVVGLLGVLKAGGAYVPLDPNYPRRRLKDMLTDARPRVLLTQERFLADLPESAARVICLDGQWAEIDREPMDDPCAPVQPDDMAYVIYTSGSTGRPKGVMISHAAIVNHMRWMQAALPLTAADRVLQKTPISFDASVWEFYAPLLAGALLVMAHPEAHADVDVLMDDISAQRITILQLVPSLLKALIDQHPESIQACGALRRVFCGGEALPQALVERFYALNPAELYNLYGPTEATIDSAFAVCRPDQPHLTAPIGRPVANTRLYILDPDLQPAAVGIPGELYLGGVGLARGYLRRPDLTAERFIPDPFSPIPGARLYRTGDRVRYLADGMVEFLGRMDQQVKLRGIRLELGEIEAVLRQHPTVKDAVSTVVDDHGGQQLTAYIVQDLDHTNPDESAAGHLSAEQISYWQEVYETVVYSQLEAKPPESGEPLPFNTTGWTSSYTGLPIPADEMAEWVEGTVRRVLQWRPRRILEIGCGTGLLLFRLAPHCAEYHGIDFSAEVLKYVQHQLNQLDGQFSQVKLSQRMADDLTGLETGYFDCVILNSIIQYFPGVDYLLKVIEGAVRVLKPGGVLFVGDVRSYPLLEMLHTSIEMAQAPEAMPAAELRQRIQQRMAQEKELVVDPDLFTALKQKLPRISHVLVQPKLGRAVNELTRFRYDVTLLIESPRESVTCTPALDWRRDGLNWDAIRQRLQATRPERLCITGVPAVRLAADERALEALRGAEADARVGDLRRILAETPSSGEGPLNPADWDGYELAVRLTAPAGSQPGAWDILFERREAAADVPLFCMEDLERVHAWSTYANNPMQAIFAQKLVPELRRFLLERLPEAVIPAYFILLDHLPVTPNGKLDRGRLPNPVQSRAVQPSGGYVSPQTPVEEKLAEIWREVLHLSQISTQDDFFELGGHSLLAAQVVSRVRRVFEIELPLRSIFTTPKLADLAVAVEDILLEEIEAIDETQTAGGGL